MNGVACMTDLVHQFITHRARLAPQAEALACQGHRISYAELAGAIQAAAAALLASGLGRRERVAVYLEKRIEAVVALFGAAAAGGVFVPVNPLLKAEQVAHILGDCNVRILFTSADRLNLLAGVLRRCPDLHTVVVTGFLKDTPSVPGLRVVCWEDFHAGAIDAAPHRAIDSDMAAILYTSGSTGRPKGVVLSHRNLVAGARSVVEYLGNTPDDRILALLPLSFDYGLSQLTTAFCSGATAVLMNYLLPRDVIKTIEEERITGLAAVPPLWIQLARQRWPRQTSLRYLTNSGGAMPQAVLASLRRALPESDVYLMYGLTEAFRSTFLPPCEIDKRPGSIGRAIPNAEVMVARPDGSPCGVDEPGELVHRGALVALGYWNDPAMTAARFRPAPGQDAGLPVPELAVWSGDTVRRDKDGFLYFIGRRDEMIKASGYRVSPTEIEEVIHATGLVTEVVAFGVPHSVLGQAIAAIVVPLDNNGLTEHLVIQECRAKLPAYMVPAHVLVQHDALPRNPNGKIDRKLLQAAFKFLFECET